MGVWKFYSSPLSALACLGSWPLCSARTPVLSSASASTTGKRQVQPWSAGPPLEVQSPEWSGSYIPKTPTKEPQLIPRSNERDFFCLAPDSAQADLKNGAAAAGYNVETLRVQTALTALAKLEGLGDTNALGPQAKRSRAVWLQPGISFTLGPCAQVGAAL